MDILLLDRGMISGKSDNDVLSTLLIFLLNLKNHGAFICLMVELSGCQYRVRADTANYRNLQKMIVAMVDVEDEFHQK